jgi:signal-transduction protein with cAMP-binding, CBS, and nucleotidyltransferase domain
MYWFVYLRRTAAEPIRRLLGSAPVTVSPGTSAAEAVQLMKNRDTCCVLVGEHGNSVGIVSETDIVRKVVADGSSPESVKVGEIMSTPLIALDIKTPAYEIYRTMANHGIRHLLITEEGRQIGFLYVKDLLRRPII